MRVQSLEGGQDLGQVLLKGGARATVGSVGEERGRVFGLVRKLFRKEKKNVKT